MPIHFSRFQSGSAPRSAEAAYSQQVSTEHRKRFGQVFTPSTLANLMADWVMQDNVESVLEPSIGTGILAAACLQYNPKCEIVGYEKDNQILCHLRPEIKPQTDVVERDFLAANIFRKFDAVIMNPPYIRHRELDGYEVVRAKISTASGCPIPRSANLYIYFSIKAALTLAPGGRAAFLLPSEWMSANFSVTFKKFLIERRLIKHIVCFSNCSSIFDGVLTTASVLLLEAQRD